MTDRASASREYIIPMLVEGVNFPVEERNETATASFVRGKHEEGALSLRKEPSLLASDNEFTIKRSMPLCNAKEKVIIVVDSAEDENCTHFKLNNNSHKPLHVVKRAIEHFLQLKSMIDQKHEYALVILNENSAVWLLNFTNNINEVISTLQNIGNCETEDIFDLNALFQVILENTDIPEECEVDEILVPPPYIVRTILFYGRSYTVPKLQKIQEIEKLLNSPYYTLDVLMTHEQPDLDNNCNTIFEVLQNLDDKGFAYFFPVDRDIKMLFYAIGKLLSHPLQRPIQKLADYNIGSKQIVR